jgi:virginiamycin B lyase
MQAPDGHLWFTERHAGDIAIILHGHVQSFHIADPTSYPDTLVSGPDGNLWFTENQASAVGRFDPMTGKFLPVIRLPNGDIPTGITVGADGNIWFTVANYTQPNSIGEVVLH